MVFCLRQRLPTVSGLPEMRPRPVQKTGAKSNRQIEQRGWLTAPGCGNSLQNDSAPRHGNRRRGVSPESSMTE